MRIFVAALLPEEIKIRIDDYIRTLKPLCGGVRWEKREKLHVTLKFLGEVEESMAGKVSSVIQGLVVNHSPFEMDVVQFGGFPSLRNPRVLFVGLSENEGLRELQQKIEDELETLGFERERRKFTPHVTIGRVRSRLRIREPLPLPEKSPFIINEIGVINSKLGREGSIYTPLTLFRLGG